MSVYYYAWLGLTIVFKLAIHIAGAVIAVLIRKVEVDPLNDSKYTAAVIYLSCVALTLIVILVLATGLYINIYAVVWPTFVALVTTVMLGLTFIPKVYERERMTV